MENSLPGETVIPQSTQNLGNTEQGAGSSKKEALNNLKKALENLKTNNNEVDAYLEIWKAQRGIEEIYQRESLGIKSPLSPEKEKKRIEEFNNEIDCLRQEYTNNPDKYESFKKIVDERSKKMIARLENDLNRMPEKNFQQEASIFLRENFETALRRAQAISPNHSLKENINNIEMSLLRLFAENKLDRYTKLLANINKGNNVDEDDLSNARSSVEQYLQENNEFAKMFIRRLRALNKLFDEAEKESQEQSSKSYGPPRWFSEVREKPTPQPSSQTPAPKPQIPDIGAPKHRADEITEEEARFDQEVAKIIEQEKGNAKAIAKKLQKASEKVDRFMFSKNSQKRQKALNEHLVLLEAFRSLNFTHENYNNTDISSFLKLHADLHKFVADFNHLRITKKDVRKFFPRLKILRSKPKPSEQDKLIKISYYIQNKKARKDKAKIVKNLKEK